MSESTRDSSLRMRASLASICTSISRCDRAATRWRASTASTRVSSVHCITLSSTCESFFITTRSVSLPLFVCLSVSHAMYRPCLRRLQNGWALFFFSFLLSLADVFKRVQSFFPLPHSLCLTLCGGLRGCRKMLRKEGS